MNGLGEGIAFAGLAIAASIIEINGYPAFVLWAIILLWWFVTDWGQDKKK